MLNVLLVISLSWGGDLVFIGGKVVMMLIILGIFDFMVYYIYVFIIYVIVLILLKGVLYVCSLWLILDKVNLGFRFFCDGLGCGGMC